MSTPWDVDATQRNQLPSPSSRQDAGDVLRDLSTKLVRLETIIASPTRGMESLHQAREDAKAALKKAVERVRNIPRTSELEKLRVDRLKSELKSMAERLEAAVRRCLKIEAQAKNVALSEENRPRKLSAGKTPLGEPLLQEQIGKAGTFELELQIEKNKELQDLERDVHEIAGLFEEVSVLVKEGGEKLDVIEAHVGNANAATAKGVDELQEAKRLAKKARKKKCCLIICLIIVLAIIGGGIGLWRGLSPPPAPAPTPSPSP